MKRVSSLNPFAASYIPLSKRNANDRTFETAKDSRSGNESSRFVIPEQLHYRAYYDSNAHGTEKAPIPEVGSTVKSHHAYGYGSSPQNVNQAADKQMLDEFDIDLEYLQMSFPGISDQSLTDVYAANRGDLEATVDMLNQLECYTVESSESLPDTLDIGDVSELGSSADCASLKLKTVEGEASAASSSS